MGFSKSCCSLFLELKKKNKLGGKILQLGRQWVFFTYEDLLKKARKCNITLNVPTKIVLSHEQYYRNLKYIDDNTLFEALGFSQVDSLDYFNNENPTFVHDLNLPVPEYLHNKYDVILDGGTSEHIFNFPQVLKNIYMMLKNDGIVIHAACPINNHVDHGYYMFSPILIYEYYLVNSYDILKSSIIQIYSKINKKWRIYDYYPQKFCDFQYGGFDNNLWGIFFICKKTVNSTCDKIPIQGCNKNFSNTNNNILENHNKMTIKKLIEKLMKKKFFPRDFKKY